jgi:hypothetical protein
VYGNRPAARQDLDGQLEWLRAAVHDPQMNARLILEVIVRVLAIVVDLLPGPPIDKGPDQ